MIEDMKKVDIRPTNSWGWINSSNNNIGGQNTQVFQLIKTSHNTYEDSEDEADNSFEADTPQDNLHYHQDEGEEKYHTYSLKDNLKTYYT